MTALLIFDSLFIVYLAIKLVMLRDSHESLKREVRWEREQRLKEDWAIREEIKNT